MFEKKEYYCWVRVIELSAERAAEPAPAVPQPTPAPLPEPADGAVLRGIEIGWREKPERKYPPAPPASQRMANSPFHFTRRHVLGMQQVTTVHLEHAAPTIFPFDIELQPVFGDKNSAIQWIESDEGARFCEDAKAVSLLCFASIGGP
jgi:hypothetical protein